MQAKLVCCSTGEIESVSGRKTGCASLTWAPLERLCKVILMMCCFRLTSFKASLKLSWNVKLRLWPGSSWLWSPCFSTPLTLVDKGGTVGHHPLIQHLFTRCLRHAGSVSDAWGWSAEQVRHSSCSHGVSRLCGRCWARKEELLLGSSGEVHPFMHVQRWPHSLGKPNMS